MFSTILNTKRMFTYKTKTKKFHNWVTWLNSHLPKLAYFCLIDGGITLTKNNLCLFEFFVQMYELTNLTACNSISEKSILLELLLTSCVITIIRIHKDNISSWYRMVWFDVQMSSELFLAEFEWNRQNSHHHACDNNSTYEYIGHWQ